jgi:hypothetical protein
MKNKYYIHENSSFQQQVLRILDTEEMMRFGKSNVLLTVERFAFKDSRQEWYKVETTRLWQYNNGKSCLGRQVPKEFVSELPH